MTHVIHNTIVASINDNNGDYYHFAHNNTRQSIGIKTTAQIGC